MTVGLEHETNRPDRPSYVTVDWASIPKEALDYFKATYGADKRLDTQNTPYDFCSVTHYPNNPPLVKKHTKYYRMGCTVGQVQFVNAQPSVLDIQEINGKYQCTEHYAQLGACSAYHK